MKQFSLTIAFLIITVLNGFNSTAQTAEAVEYMNSITETTEETNGETWRYLKAATRGKSMRKVEKKRQKLIDEIREVKSEVARIGDFNGDDSYRQSVFEFLDLTYIVIQEDFDKILDMEEIAEQSYDAMEAYLLAKEKANDKLDSAFAIVADAQASFAAKYNIEIVEGERNRVQRKIAAANEAIKYYNQFYLIFFKAYKQEAYVMDALERKDMMSLEQNANALVSASEEGIEKLRNVDGYNGDGSLKIATRKILEFYRTEGGEDFPAMVDFHLKQENFEKLRKVIETKKKKDLTKEEIDEYNAAVKEYNEMVPEYNKLSEQGNDNRNDALDDWNDSVDDFFDKHS